MAGSRGGLTGVPLKSDFSPLYPKINLTYGHLGPFELPFSFLPTVARIGQSLFTYFPPTSPGLCTKSKRRRGVADLSGVQGF
ncbi:hypothetical protein SLEP1_g14652 [Rubroshorea leprosula]|uniref:Uncharacterized protein n=1 Tax=Rubroshorea leprosula TaxID=152421 RepID=A0AAV5IQQ0_9ROSI|nr:hypothetical protein SLEP1_g14652 [Rubroshorea leprosula]